MPTVCVCVCMCVCASETLFCGPHINSSNRLTSWFQQLADMMKFCTRPVVLTLTFSWPFLDLFSRSRKLRNFSTLYHERGSLCGHHSSLNRLTLTFNHGFNSSNDDVDILLWPWPFCDALKGHRQLRFFPLFAMDAQLNAGGFDSVGVTLLE